MKSDSKNSSHICRIESIVVSESGIIVDAQDLSRPSVLYENVPVVRDFSGKMAIPKPGQRIVVSISATGFEYVDGILTGPDSEIPEMDEDEFVLQFNKNTKISFIKDQNEDYELKVKTDGDATLNASGQIVIGEGSNAEPVARQNHDHDYSWDSDGGSGTTSTPNQTGTDTDIE